ncbi:hypothetical protein LIER_24108 [Lithospermum erythrorhizon]|uniref:Uncharacterized protein n=1 Tax=Lithospermum erythrorhizon TaxID=34254 RepID=A0AAV3R5L2_LITER
MPRSSRHKSHKQSKHSSKGSREYSDSEVEDVKRKESGSGSVSDRVVKDLGHLTSGEKRKLSSQVKELKDLSLHRNGDAGDEYVSSKRRKEKGTDKSNGGDRWNGGDGREGVEKEKKGESLKNDGEKGSKSREAKSDVKSRSSKRHESDLDTKEDNGALLEEKEYNRSGSRTEKRKSEKEKDGKDNKESREKERGSEKEKKGVESGRSNEVNVGGDVMRKQDMRLDEVGEDGLVKRSRNNAEFPSPDEMRNVEIDEKRARKKKESSGDLDKYQDDIKDGGVRRLSSRSERVKEGRSLDEKIKQGCYRDKYYEDVDKDVKYHDDLEKDSKHREDKYRDDGDRDSRHRDDVDRDGQRRENKYREDSGRDAKRRDDKHQGESERDYRRRDDKYRDDGEKDNRRKDEKHREDIEKESRHSDTRYYDDADRDGRHKVERFRDADRDIRHKEDKYRDDYERENRHRDKVGDEVDREKRFRDGKYRDDRLPKDRSGDKSDSKRPRDENHVSGFHPRKSSLYDDSDDRMSRYKEDLAEKHSSGQGRGDFTNERGRSTSKIADSDTSATHYRRQSSPSSGSHVISNQYRLSKQDEPTYKDYGVTPYREHEKKHLQRDDANSGELAAERRIRPDAHASPMPLMDKSPSSTMSERRHSRTDVRRNLDVNESGRRYGSSRDGKDFPGREARGNRDAMETFPGDEFSQVDGDNGSVSSPFARSGNLSNSAKSLLPPPPFRTGVDSPLPFGMSDDDSRGKSINRHRRLGDTSMGRMHGNSWRGAPNWSSPVANGFMPFQHGPPPVGFHPVMHQFPAPPLFGVRPSMDLNHHGLPFPITDVDRFSGHVRSMGWRNLVDDSCPPPLHGWDANSSAFNEDSHLLGRPDWDNSRIPVGVKTTSASTEMTTSEKQNISMQEEADDYIAGQFSKQSQLVNVRHDHQADSTEVGPLNGSIEKETSEPSPKFGEISSTEGKFKKDDHHLCRAYLSKLDISADLAGPELYEQCAKLLGVDHNLHFDVDESKILYLEEAVDGKAASNKVPSTFVFTATDDSVFEKAMMLYKKHKEEFTFIKLDSPPPSGVENALPILCGETMSNKKDVAVEEMEVAAPDLEQIDLPNISQEVKEPNGVENVEAALIPDSQNRVADLLVDKTEVSVCATSNTSMEVQVSSDIEARDINTSMEVQVSSDIEARDINDNVIEDNLGLETVDSPAIAVENEMTISSDATLTSDMPISSILEKEGMDVKCGLAQISDVPEAVMPESVESESVNLSRIHHSPESTH